MQLGKPFETTGSVDNAKESVTGSTAVGKYKDFSVFPDVMEIIEETCKLHGFIFQVNYPGNNFPIYRGLNVAGARKRFEIESGNDIIHTCNGCGHGNPLNGTAVSTFQAGEKVGKMNTSVVVD